MPSSGMYRRVGLVRTDVSEERVASIFRVKRKLMLTLFLENTMLQKLDLFPSSGEGRETPTLLGPLKRANLNHKQSVF
jgi:hypothetical protein